MSRNWPLIIKVLHQIHRHPETWNQASWAHPCGTQFCFAGHAITLSGYEFAFGPWETVTQWVKVDGALADLNPVVHHHHRLHGLVTPAPTAGAALLGLEPAEGRQLFAPCNSFSEILALVNVMAVQDEFTLPEELQLTPEQVQYALTETEEEELRAMDRQLLYPPIEVQR